MFGGQIFEGRNEIFLLGKALKFGVIFPKICIKIIKKLEKLLRKFLKNENFSEIFNFWAVQWDK